MNGGYLIVSKDDTNLYEKLNKALTLGKPVLWYENENTCYFIDDITKSGTDIVLKKGGKTITIESDGDIIESGTINKIFMNTIIDNDSNERFIEGDNEDSTITGMTINYSKWSLSGTHLMVVLAGRFDNGSVISGKLTTLPLPEWIADKIVPVSNILVDYKKQPIFDDTLATSQDMVYNLSKDGDGVYIRCNAITLTADRNFRIQFDLLIDAE